ncbi:MAG TPA: winged helix-turn-helix transcriptional regulator [Actinomycetota bacterium]|jgi:DNA-binding HxlR family transcriptional regulator
MTRGYGQYCGLAKALELIGGRWALLIVRELLTGPKRYTELQHGLPGIPTNILSSRLRELEEAGLVERSLVAHSSSVVYGLTDYGLDLEEAVVRLGVWGSKSLGRPGEDASFSLSALALALRGAFDPSKATGRELLFEIRLGDEPPLVVMVSEGRVSFPTGPPSRPIVLETAPEVMSQLLAGSLDVRAAVASGRAKLEGSIREASRFFEIFRLPAREPVAG